MPLLFEGLIYQNKRYVDETTNEVITPGELRKRGESEGMYIKVHEYKLATKITWFLLALLFSWTIIPAIVLFIKGLQKLVQRHVYMEKEVAIANYAIDKRYKDGKRLKGYSNDTIRLKVPALLHEKTTLIKTGAFYILLSLVIGYTGAFIIKSTNESDQTKQYEKFLDRAQSEKALIQLHFETTNDSTEYKKQMEEFNKKLEEATNYINNKKNE